MSGILSEICEKYPWDCNLSYFMNQALSSIEHQMLRDFIKIMAELGRVIGEKLSRVSGHIFEFKISRGKYFYADGSYDVIKFLKMW